MTFREGEHIKVWDEQQRHALMRFIKEEGWDCKEGKDVVIVGKKLKYEIDRKLLARTLRLARRAKGYSREEIAKKVGVREESVWNWEVGYTIPREDNLKKYCKLVNLSPKGVIKSCTIEI